MDNVKRAALVLALVAGLCGGSWALDWGHRNTQNTHATRAWQGGSAVAHERASVIQNHSWGTHNNTATAPYRNGSWGAYRNNPNYQYRNGSWVYGPNRTWGANYPYGNTGVYPYPTTGGYYPYPTTGGYYPNTGGYYGYPTAGGYPGGYGGYGASPSAVYGGEYQRGYRDGMVFGRTARGSGHAYHPAQQASYKHGTLAYRQGYAAGYQRGYMGRF